MRARLINPQLLTVQPQDRAGTLYDEQAGEPFVQLARAAELQIKAQVDVDQENRRRPGQGGAELPKRIRLSFLVADLLAAGWTPADGDRVVAVSNLDGSYARTVNWYATECRDTAVERHGPKVLEVLAEDRPGRRVTEGRP